MGFLDNIRDVSLVALEAAQSFLARPGDVGFRKADSEGPEATPGGTQADSAGSNPVPTMKADADPKTMMWDPFAIIEQLGYKDRPSAITNGTLKAICWKVPTIHTVIMTRVRQVAAFSTPTTDRYQLGFRIKTRDTEKEPTKAERLWCRQMEALIMRTGVTNNPRARNTFEAFLIKLAWDSLVYDQMCFEIVPNRKNEPAEWYAVDAATIRLADSASTYLDEDLDKAVRYVQIYDGMIITEYNQEELCFGVRNPRTDIRLFGYGTSELEMLIPTVTSLLYSCEYNQKFFSQGSAAKGIINFKGTVPEKQLQAFKNLWYQQIASVQNAWRTPIVNSDDLQYINLQQSSRDMEFSAWMDFLLKVSCAMYAMDPSEINFKYGNTGQKGGLQEANNREKITESKERGLRPLLRFISNEINTHIIWPTNENFEFAFMGLDAETKDDVAALNQKRGKTMMTVDELRAEDDKPPLPDGKGEVILDPTWLQHAQMKEGVMEGGAEMGEGDGEDADGDDDGDESDSKKKNFQAMLDDMDDGDDEDEDGDEEEDKKKKPGEKPVKKSLSRKTWTVNL